MRSGIIFLLTRLICSQLSKAVCCFWFVTSQGQWEFKKRQEFTISWIFCPSNEHNSNVQSFPENKYSFTGRLSLCVVRESNRCQQFGRLLWYHYTNDAEKVYDRRDQFQNFQTWIFHYTFSECHIKKNQNYSLRSGVVFSLTRLIFFSLFESCCFWFVTCQGLCEFKKRKEFSISWNFCPSNAQNSNVQSFREFKNVFTGEFMHRTGIEAMSTAWKAAMLPLHQRCCEGLRSKRWISELSNMDFSLHIFWVSHQEKTKTILW